MIKSLIVLMLIWLIHLMSLAPSNDRDWIPEQKILADYSQNWDLITINNIRNNKYQSDSEFNSDYYNAEFNLNKIKSLDYILVPFWMNDMIAHSFLSFGFDDWKYISISIEWRKEIWEWYHPISWMLRKFELIYVVWDEKDVVDLRLNHYKDKVHLYPLNVEKKKIAAIFIDMLERVNNLRQTPEFYHTIIDNCTNSLWKHAKNIWSDKIKFNTSLIVTWWSDEYLFDIGLIKTDAASIEELRGKHLVPQWIVSWNDPDFSRKIRTWLK